MVSFCLKCYLYRYFFFFKIYKMNQEHIVKNYILNKSAALCHQCSIRDYHSHHPDYCLFNNNNYYFELYKAVCTLYANLLIDYNTWIKLRRIALFFMYSD